jgi:hypothetical protein
MSEERKANLEAMLAELEHELWLAVLQGELVNPLQWTAVIHAEGKPPFIAILSVDKVEEQRK